MGIINKYGDPTITIWEIDDNGNKVSIPIVNESKQVIGNKFTLEGFPDEQSRVFIDGFVEIDITEPITAINQFKVDYRKSGSVFVHEDLDGQTITVSRYRSRGMIYFPASRIWTKVDEFGNVMATLDDAVEDIAEISDIIRNLGATIEEARTVRIQLDRIITSGGELNGMLIDTVALGEELQQELPQLVSTADSSITSLEGTIANSNTAKSELSQKISEAQTTKGLIDSSISNAEEINNTLSNPTTGTIKRAIDANSNLESTIGSVDSAEAELRAVISASVTAKVNLDESILEANSTKTNLDNSIAEGNVLKGDLDAIIAGTDFEQVIIDIRNLKEDQHNHSNKIVLDKLSEVSGQLKFDGQDVGVGDMQKSVYDTNNNGKVDMAENSEKLGGNLPAHYARKSDIDSKVSKTGDTMTGDLILSGNILSTEFKSDNWSFINHYTGTGGWARSVLTVKDKDRNNYMQVGIHGSGQNFNRMYFGKSWDDWAMEMFPSNKKVNFGGSVTKLNKEIATEDYVVDRVKTPVPVGAVFTDTKPQNDRTGEELFFWHGTQEQYDSITTPNPNTVYLIKE